MVHLMIVAGNSVLPTNTLLELLYNTLKPVLCSVSRNDIMTKKMRLAIFDLDYTIWKPEMYQLSGPPRLIEINKLKMSPSQKVLQQAKTRKDGMILTDRRGDIMQVFPGASLALTEINQMKKEGYDIKAAVASRTDEPQWARTCMEHLVIADGSTLQHCFGNFVEINYGSKVVHIQSLHQKTGIPFEEMCFFDNEFWNIQDVSKSLPVKCIYTPDGMTLPAWEEAKAAFGLS